MKLRALALPLLVAAACRQPLPVDTSASRFIPRDVAIDRLKELLASADSIERTVPRAWFKGDEVTEWIVNDERLEARGGTKPAVGVAFKDVTATRLERVNLFYQLRIFTPAQTNPKKDFLHVNWTQEEPARRALELVDALWRKP